MIRRQRLSDRRQDRRAKTRFGIRRELRYKLLEGDEAVEAGTGFTVDIASGGVAFLASRRLPYGAFLEVSISWPALLNKTCPMRLNVFGRVLRTNGELVVCSIDKYEFRVQARSTHEATAVRQDSMLQRWAETVRRAEVQCGAAGA